MIGQHAYGSSRFCVRVPLGWGYAGGSCPDILDNSGGRKLHWRQSALSSTSGSPDNADKLYVAWRRER